LKKWKRDVNLGSDVVRCSAEGRGGRAVFDALFAHAEVGDFAVTIRVQQNVIQLQISGEKKVMNRLKKCLEIKT